LQSEHPDRRAGGCDVSRTSSGVIQGSFVGGQPRIVQAALAVRPAVQSKPTPTPKPGPVQFKPDARGRLAPPPLPPRVVAGRAGPVQAKGAGDAFPLPPGFRLRTGGGQPLPPAVQAHMEGVLGANFADVRVHVGNEASSIGALAFTHGSDVYFAPGQYQPNTSHGLKLIGHELTHVIQQRAGRVQNPLGSGVAVVQDAALEAEADRMGEQAFQVGRECLNQSTHTLPLQRKTSPSNAAPVVQLNGKKNKKQEKKKKEKILSGKRWESWPVFWDRCFGYVKGSKETVAWLKKAQAMGMEPPPKPKGAHKRGADGDFTDHVTQAVKLYIDESIMPAWKKLEYEEKEQYKEAAAML
jgi:hypothetical protein